MSAICGILRFDGRPVAEREVERMLAAMAPRAPDRCRVMCDGSLVLGHGLMRITQEDWFDHQPLVAGAITLVADLRLDNREELAAKLGVEVAALRQMPDSALLLAAWQRWGKDCVTHLLGDFAFAIWNAVDRVLFLARDPMGQRSLLWHCGPDFFAFSTDIKGLWALREVPPTHSGHPMRRLADGPIASSCPDPTGSLDGGASMMVGADGTRTDTCFWSPAPDPIHQGRDDAYYVASYRQVLEEAVACRVRRNLRPAGLLFSGGFDSAAIAALTGPVLKERGQKLVAAASVMPEDYVGTIRHARRWTEICRREMPHLDLRYVTRQGLDVLTGLEQAFLRSGGQGPDHHVETALLQTLAEGGARVVMDGNGGDYTLNVRGFPWLLDLFRKGQWREVVAEMRAFHRRSGTPYWKIARVHLVSHFIPWRLREMRRRHRHGLALQGPTMPVTPDFLAARHGLPAFLSTKPPANAAEMRALLRAVLRTQQRRRPGIEAAAAALGLEVTRPFHDRRVVELALAIPERLWVQGGRERHLARVALKDIYPMEFQTRGRGNDARTPDFLQMVRTLEPRLLAEIARMEQGGKLGGFFDFPKMRRMLSQRPLDDHNSGAEYDTQQAVAALLQARYMEWLRREN